MRAELVLHRVRIGRVQQHHVAQVVVALERHLQELDAHALVARPHDARLHVHVQRVLVVLGEEREYVLAAFGQRVERHRVAAPQAQ